MIRERERGTGGKQGEKKSGIEFIFSFFFEEKLILPKFREDSHMSIYFGAFTGLMCCKLTRN